MKKVILTIISFIAFIILIGETEELTFSLVLLKVLSLIWLWLIIKANNYFYQGD
jgi:membrane protein YqaA with SNARE-associated domain